LSKIRHFRRPIDKRTVVRASVSAWREISKVVNGFSGRPIVVIRGSVFVGEVVGSGPLRLRLKAFLGFGAGCSYIVLGDGSIYSIASKIPWSDGFKRLYRGVPGSKVRHEFIVEAGPLIEPISSGGGSEV
jgi:hypothetical protein